VRLDGDRVLVDPRPHPPGTPIEPARIAGAVREESDELYVGYLPAAPPRVARFVRRLVPALLVTALAVAALVAVLQAPFARGVFEFGSPRSVRGTLIERPYPLLVEDGTTRAALLVREGKHGASSDGAGLDGRRVELEATRIESPLGRMLEIVPGTLEGTGTDRTLETPDPVGPVANLLGEIVDSKCFLGVMKPGQGKPHRACAARCLSGGIPPQLLVESADGSARLLLLATADGGALAPASFLDLVGEPVVASGTVERRAGLLVLRLDEAGLRRW